MICAPTTLLTGSAYIVYTQVSNTMIPGWGSRRVNSAAAAAAAGRLATSDLAGMMHASGHHLRVRQQKLRQQGAITGGFGSSGGAATDRPATSSAAADHAQLLLLPPPQLRQKHGLYPGVAQRRPSTAVFPMGPAMALEYMQDREEIWTR